MTIREVKFEANPESANECLDKARKHGLQDCIVIGYDLEGSFVTFLSDQLQVRDVAALHRMLGIGLDRELAGDGFE